MKLENQVMKQRDQIDAFRQSERQQAREQKKLMQFMEEVKAHEKSLIEKVNKLKS